MTAIGIGLIYGGYSDTCPLPLEKERKGMLGIKYALEHTESESLSF